MRAADYLGPSGPLAATLPGYEPRPGQLRMADAVQETLEREGILLVEAGTGTGKTLAYLVPAILSGLKVVVSTATRTLQDQIIEHDLPLLEKHLGMSIPTRSMKGLSNYLCLRRYEEFRKSAGAVEGELASQLASVERWRERTTHGDRAELDALPEHAPIWRHVVSSSETRIGPRCAHYEDCFVTRMRRDAEGARLIVVNHHLYFADVALRRDTGSGILPEHDVVIFDEAHQIEDVATHFFGVQFTQARVDRLVADAELELLAEAPETRTYITAVVETAAAFFSAFPRPISDESRRLPVSAETFSGTVQSHMFALDTALEAFASHCARNVPVGENFAQLARRAQRARDDLAFIADATRHKRVAWVEARARNVSLGANPIEVTDTLREELFFRNRTVVLTSATLTTSHGFDFVRRRLGLDFEVREEVVPSPFDYESQAAFYVPSDIVDPRSASYIEQASNEIDGLLAITNGGAFVLCTSLRMMTELARRARARGMDVLVQGEAPKSTLLEKFRSTGNAVLFATASFWEGVDVPGDALRLVIIDKLPFDVPSDPLIAARCARMREEGEEPFMEYLVPNAALMLKQGFGRLVRTTRDRGIVAVLDSRIVKKGYGKVFMRSLPAAKRCTSLEEVRAFWNQTN